MQKTILPQWAAYGRLYNNVPGPARGASLAGQPFLSDSLGPNARIVVEIAWGADPAGDFAVWSWTDITGTVYQNPGISFKYGRADEASKSQPATGSMTLDNSDAAYSLGGISPNWPNVKLNVPVRVRVDPNGTGFQVIFQGNVTSLEPSWDTTGNIATAKLEVGGTLQRLIQHSEDKRSAPYRYVLNQMSPVDGTQREAQVYYPLNEGALARSGAAAVGTGTATVASFFLTADAPSKFFGQGKLAPWLPEGFAVHKLVNLVGSIPSASVAPTFWVFDCLVTIPNAGSSDSIQMQISVDEGPVATSDVHYVLVIDTAAKQITARATVGLVDNESIPSSWEPLFDGGVHHVRMWGSQSGAVCSLVIYIDDVLAASVNSPTHVLQQPDHWTFYASGTEKQFAGHAVFYTSALWAPFGNDTQYRMLGSVSESAVDRIERLCTEDSIPLNIIGDTGSATDTAAMGQQPTAGTVTLLRECEACDQGVLYDGLSSGLEYVTRDERENADAVMIVDVGAQELFIPFNPKYNDARRINKAKASRSLGGDYTYEDAEGPLGTTSIGTYDTSITVNIDDDDNVGDFASWLVHLGTVDGYRYPTVVLNIEQNPRLASYVLALHSGSRIDLTNIHSALPTHDIGTVSLLVEGVSMNITPYSWMVTLQCSLYNPWQIITLAATTGDTTETICHLGASNSRITIGADVGATSLTVETVSGPVWTQTADDFPFYVLVGGIKTRVTNVTGASSPQTFTVDAMSLSRVALSPVEIWNPPALRL